MCSVFFLFNLCHSTLLFSTSPHPSLFASSSFPVKLLFLLVLQLQLQLQRLGFNAQTRTDSLPPVCVFTHLCGFFPLCYYLANNNKSQPFKCYFRDGFRSCCSSRSVLNPRRRLAAPIQRPAVIFMMPHNISLECVLKRG